jgi:glutamine synthetase
VGPDGPLDRTPYAGSFALTAAAGLVAELAEMGIRPEQCHAEVGHGNLELSAADRRAQATMARDLSPEEVAAAAAMNY